MCLYMKYGAFVLMIELSSFIYILMWLINLDLSFCHIALYLLTLLILIDISSYTHTHVHIVFHCEVAS